MRQALGIEEGVLVRARDAERRARFLDALGGDAEVEVAVDSGGDELLQGVVVEKVEPFGVGDGGGRFGLRRGVELRGQRHVRTLVVGADSAGGESEEQNAE